MKKINVGFIGLGLMGLPMAKNILKKKYPLIVWSRSKKNYKDIEKLGATTCQNLTDLADKCQIIIMMLFDDVFVCESIATPSAPFDSHLTHVESNASQVRVKWFRPEF